MIRHVGNQKDLCSGLIFISVGCIFLYVGSDYGLGTARRMGPAYFPSLISIALICVGAIVAGRSFFVAAGGPVKALLTRPLAWLLGGTLAFAVLLPTAGLIVACIVLVGMSAAAGPEMRWKETLLLAAGLTLLAVLLFAQALKIPMPILGPVLGG